MKKKLLITIIFISTFIGNSFSQEYHPMLNNSSWLLYDVVSCCRPSEEKTIEEGTDEAVGSITYKKFIDPFADSSDNTVYLREDIIEKKVYKLVNGAEVLLYDFSLENSNTISQNGKTFTATVDYINVNGGTRKRITLNSIEPASCGETLTQIWIEGVGSNKHPFYPDYNMGAVCSSGGGYNIFTKCSFQNGEHIYGNSDCSLPLLIETPTALSQTFCSGTTVANLAATGTDLKWYLTSSGGTALIPTTPLSTQTYFVSQTLNGSESARTSVAVTVNTCPAQHLICIHNYVYTNIIAGAQSYTWEIKSLDNNSNPTSQVEIKTTKLRYVKIYELPKFVYNKQYSVRVAVTKNGVLGDFGTAIIVKTPSASSTVLNVCGTTIASMSKYIYSSTVRFALGYRYTLTNTVNTTDVHTITSLLPAFKLEQISGLHQGTIYDLKVEVKNLDGTYLPVAPSSCRIKTPAAAGIFARSTSASLKSDFNAITYPNPFKDQFAINVSSISQDKVNIKVYDMEGRLVEQKNANVSELETAQIGNNYQVGVYNITVSQGSNVKTLRVIKR